MLSLTLPSGVTGPEYGACSPISTGQMSKNSCGRSRDGVSDWWVVCCLLWAATSLLCRHIQHLFIVTLVHHCDFITMVCKLTTSTVFYYLYPLSLLQYVEEEMSPSVLCENRLVQTMHCREIVDQTQLQWQHGSRTFSLVMSSRPTEYLSQFRYARTVYKALWNCRSMSVSSSNTLLADHNSSCLRDWIKGKLCENDTEGETATFAKPIE